MDEFSVGAARFDPYKNFRFRVKWDGRYVAGVSRVSALRRQTEVIRYRSGGDPAIDRRSPGRTEYAPITLERGVTSDREFELWANKLASGPGGTARDFRKELVIEVYDEAGQLATAYRVHRCWVADYQALPELDADANAVALQSLTLEHEGWDRDDLADQAEPHRAEPGRRPDVADGQ